MQDKYFLGTLAQVIQKCFGGFLQNHFVSNYYKLKAYVSYT